MMGIYFSDGQLYPGLPIVDGVTVTMSFNDALASALVDVPLLLQSMQAEVHTLLFLSAL